MEVTGRQVHGSAPHKGVNALYAAGAHDGGRAPGGKEFAHEDNLFRPPRPPPCEPTAKEKGVENINTIPGRDVFHIDCRVLPGIPLEQVLSSFSAASPPSPPRRARRWPSARCSGCKPRRPRPRTRRWCGP